MPRSAGRVYSKNSKAVVVVVRKFAPILIPVLAVIVLVTAAAWYLHGRTIAVLQPAGQIGKQELQLIQIALLLSVIVVVPVFTLAITIAWRYRAGNKKAKYDPEFSHSRVLETIWWGIPITIITVLSVITWRSAHQLDPYRPISGKGSVNVQVVSLDWKWLFIYPNLGIASVNSFDFPTGAAVNFQITSDTVMNSFWVPQLGGQIYAMPGMATQLHLEADRSGSYLGSSANISGSGFADMTFKADAVSNSDFNTWLADVRKSKKVLGLKEYDKLAEASDGYPVTYYSHVDSGLFDSIVAKYMSPNGDQGMVMQ